MRKVLLCNQCQLFIVSRVVGHDGVLTAVVDHGFAARELDDRRVPAGVFEREMNGGLPPVCLHHHRLECVHQGQRIGDGACLVEQILAEQSHLDSRPAGITGPDVGGLEVQGVHP